MLWVPVGAVVGFGRSPLQILWCLIQGGAFSQVGAPKQPLYPIVPPPYSVTSQWVGTVVGLNQAPNPTVPSANAVTHYSQVPSTLLLPACGQGSVPPQEPTQPSPPHSSLLLTHVCNLSCNWPLDVGVPGPE